MSWRLRKKKADPPAPERLPAPLPAAAEPEPAPRADEPAPAPTGPRREQLPDGILVEHSAAMGTSYVVPAGPGSVDWLGARGWRRVQ